MESGSLRRERIDILELACLVWQPSFDAEAYLWFGHLNIAGNRKGKKPILSPKLQAAVDKEVARLRAEDPSAPKVTMG